MEFLRGFRVGLRRMPTEALVTMPSTYPLFPHPIRTCLLNILLTSEQPLQERKRGQHA
ncbi:MAG: hypothetical protein OEM43_05090 [Gammaproteobacteria bacterium]|nr:hypothetical protein [Gammaproteobacteria bacterium]